MGDPKPNAGQTGPDPKKRGTPTARAPSLARGGGDVKDYIRKL